MTSKSYRELSRLHTFEERFRYLRLRGDVGRDTFGFDRVFNQKFYNSSEWKRVRRKVILRDNGCDLGIPGHDISGVILIHHLNPITMKDIEDGSDALLDPDNLICTSHLTHNAIHYGDENLLPKNPIERKPNDTCPWKKAEVMLNGSYSEPLSNDKKPLNPGA